MYNFWRNYYRISLKYLVTKTFSISYIKIASVTYKQLFCSLISCKNLDYTFQLFVYFYYICLYLLLQHLILTTHSAPTIGINKDFNSTSAWDKDIYNEKLKYFESKQYCLYKLRNNIKCYNFSRLLSLILYYL